MARRQCSWTCRTWMEEPSRGELAPGWMVLEFTRTRTSGEQSQVHRLFCPECGAEMLARLARFRGDREGPADPPRTFPNDPPPPPRDDRPRRPWEGGR